MADPQTHLVGIVIKPDGTVPFDHDCHPEVRKHIIAFLADNGNTIVPVDGTNHVRIHGWTPGKNVHKKHA